MKPGQPFRLAAVQTPVQGSVQPAGSTCQTDATTQTVPRDRLIPIDEVMTLTGYRKSSIYALMAAGELPRCVRLSPRCVRWSERAILQWVQDRLTA